MFCITVHNQSLAIDQCYQCYACSGQISTKEGKKKNKENKERSFQQQRFLCHEPVNHFKMDGLNKMIMAAVLFAF